MYRTALARTHRPRRFADLVGQDHVASTLRVAVETGRAAHAYLFCGPRGIGKTTAARVLAMALNCADRADGEPCGSCESCTSIWSGRTSLDVVEIDAASNRGVDDARDLRERAMYAPSDEKRYKVYIIDEAHMLTREAWNALLKILEEPPPRVIFVFATTEPQKIRQSASPVMSRVQRFDFRRVSVSDLVSRLAQVLELEGVAADENALLPIARRAEGGVRDALSLLDQVLSFSGDQVSTEDVRKMLGLVEEERFLELLEIVHAGDRAAVFPFVQALLDEGYDLAEFVQGLGDTLRAVLALSLDPESDATELSAEARVSLAAISQRFSAEDLLRLLVATADFESAGRFRRSAQPRIQVEVLLLRLASLESSVEFADLLQMLGDAGASAVPVGHRSPPVPKDPAPRKSKVTRSPAPRATPADAELPALESEPEPTSSNADEVAGVRPADEGHMDVRQAWAEALEAAKGSAPGGRLVGLRGATVAGFADGQLALEIPAGLAGDLEKFLADAGRSAALRRELGARLGIDPASLGFRVGDGGVPHRITAESARDLKLQRLVETDPRLREAVEVLDLKLTEE
ncbi:MAG: DNA polymerase III subunit gamma/tau [Gemmatimonadetes bacterium]|nr:DNA polymerase III subunit gamma/tau [Gemmatimonadota bacterium]